MQSPEREALLKKRRLRHVGELSDIGEWMLDTTKGFLDTAQSEMSTLNRHMSTIADAVKGSTAAIESLVQFFTQQTRMTGQTSNLASCGHESGGCGGVLLRRLRALLAKRGKAAKPWQSEGY
uniref:Uncharacterized protein n=1 Tax=Sphaerodactylus townsendi TaxID=933632 RepID=A0ACB8F8M7_9SAUR